MDVTPVLITAEALVVRIHNQVVLDGATLAVHAGERAGLVGRNGAGKSTILRLLAGVDQPDAGEVMRRRDLRVGYLPQDADLALERSVRDNILDGARDILELLSRYEALPHDSEAAHALEHAILALDGWNLDTRLAELADRLEIPELTRPTASLSGGERRRAALARALIGQPELLILDEPTNHLDTAAIEWLEEFLGRYPGACLMVTHDRYFLDRVVTRIFDLASGRIAACEGNYTRYLEFKAARDEESERLEDKRQTFLRREIEWIRRGPKARTTKAQSRVDRFWDTANQKTPERDRDVELIIPEPAPLGNKVLALQGVSARIGERVLFPPFDLVIAPGARIGVVGRNGAGKTTLLRLILGERPPDSGTVVTGERTRFNYVDQHRLRLDENKTVVQEIGEGKDFISLGVNERISIWGYLKRFLFTDDRINTEIRYLSGGERSRLLLAKILKNGGNFLVLDEPTNDLDLPTLRILEEALAAFPGCVLVVSHDRYFLNRVCTAILAFEPDGALVYQEGDYDYYRDKRRLKLAAARAESAGAAAGGTAALAAPAPAAAPVRKLKYMEQKELEGMEAAIAAAEADVARREAQFAEPEFYVRHAASLKELTAELEAARVEVTRLYARWDELETIRRASPR